MAKIYEVIKATKQDLKGLAVKHKGAMKYMKFNKSGALRLHDKALAHDIEQQHNFKNGDGAVVVAEVEQQVSNDPLHKYFFGGNPELPWKKDNPNYDEFGRRIEPEENRKHNVPPPPKGKVEKGCPDCGQA